MACGVWGGFFPLHSTYSDKVHVDCGALSLNTKLFDLLQCWWRIVDDIPEVMSDNQPACRPHFD